MSIIATVDDDVREAICAFFAHHGIQRVVLTLTDGVTSSYKVCNLAFEFAASERQDDYIATFKLQGDDARIGAAVASIDDRGHVELAAGASPDAPIGELIDTFLQRISKRIAKLKQEQDVQSVTFLGNSFLLHGVTMFSVVTDDDGVLGIEIHKADCRQPAQMMASNLLDGLYDGSIELL